MPWLKNLIRPVFLMMLFIRAEREGDFPLHIYACKEMLPYFFAAGHINYARYGLFYLLTMTKLPPNILDKFLSGEHVLHHKQGIWNGIWSDMMIETTFMKFGKGPTGIIGKTTNPRTIQIWAKSQHRCNEVLQNLDVLRNKNEKIMKTHKEETSGRIKNDQVDQTKLKNFLITCIHPLESKSHTLSSLYNIYTGQIAGKTINVNKAVDIGKEQMKSFQSNLPEGFRSKLKKEVVTMKTPKEVKNKTAVEVYNTEIIFSRFLYLNSANKININDLFSYELAPIPTALFKDTGEGRYPTAKADLKNAFKSRGFSKKY